MQVGVEDLTVAELRPFGGLRFLDLHHHVGLLEDIRGGGNDLRAGGAVGIVISADAGAGLGFDDDVVAMRHIFANSTRRQTDPIFVILDFLRTTDTHARSSPVIFRYPRHSQRDHYGTRGCAQCPCKARLRNRS